MTEIQPHWDAQSEARLFERTSTVYSSLDLNVLDERGLNTDLLEALISILPEGAYIAGGYMTAVLAGKPDEAHDVDLFFNGPEAFKNTLNAFKNTEDLPSILKGYKVEGIDKADIPKKETRFVKLGASGRPDIQLIKTIWYNGPEHLIDTFDFTIAQAATDGTNLYVNPITPMDIVRRHIVLHKLNFPASTMRRLIKYAKKGYYACPGALANLAEEVKTVLTKDPSTNTQVVYID